MRISAVTPRDFFSYTPKSKYHSELWKCEAQNKTVKLKPRDFFSHLLDCLVDKDDDTPTKISGEVQAGATQIYFVTAAPIGVE